MEKLANSAPDNAQSDFDGVPENRMEAGCHARILVQIERGDADYRLVEYSDLTCT
jgi:hypothetical protein